MYKVIFNQDESNYEEFDSLEKAEEFAKRYVNTEVKKYAIIPKTKRKKDGNTNSRTTATKA